MCVCGGGGGVCVCVCVCDSLSGVLYTAHRWIFKEAGTRRQIEYLWRFKSSSSTLRRIWAKLYAGELVLLTTGQTEISSLWILSCALIFLRGGGMQRRVNL